MKWNKYIIIMTIAALGLLASIAAQAQDIGFEARIDKTRMSYQDVLVLSLVLSGSKIDMNVIPEMPDLEEHFDILRGPNRSTSISIANGRQSSFLTIQYMLSPKKTGIIEIPPISITRNNKTYSSETLRVEVLKIGASSPQTPSQTSPGSANQPDPAALPEVFLQADVDKQNAYPGEQITISYKLYTRVNISGYNVEQQPGFTGFWVEELETPQPPKLQQTSVNGQQYSVALMKKFALFPTSSGELAIEPMTMSLGVRAQRRRSRDPFDMFFDDPFGRVQEIVRKTEPISLTVLPLPEENRPDFFNGDVGSYTMSVELDPQEVAQDEPVTLRVSIQGSGNIKTVKEPLISLPASVKRYDTQITESPYTLQEPIQGEKLFETVLIPSEAGTFQIEAVQFAFFDPQRKRYQMIRSQPLELAVTPGTAQPETMSRRIATKEEVKLLGQDIRFIKTDVPRLTNQGRYWYQSGFFQFALMLPLCAVFAAWGYKQYRSSYMNDERYLRRKRAVKRSKQRLKAAITSLEDDDPKEFHAAISSALRQYIGDKLNRPPAGIHADDISRELQEYGLSAEHAGLLKDSLELCDYARFAPVDAGREEMQSILRDAETLIEAFEGLKGFGRHNKTRQKRALLWLFVLLSGLAAPLSVKADAPPLPAEELFRQGNNFYQESRYQEAISSYEQILANGLENGYVYYNLGNVLLKEQRIGEAILQYERAKRLLPRDEDVAFNLNYARALTLDKMDAEGGKLSQALAAARNYFTPNEVALTLWIGYGLLSSSIVAFMFVPRRWKLRLLYLALPAALLLLGASLLLYLQSSYIQHDEAILLVQQVSAKTGPGEGYSDVFEIHEGAKVRIQREKLDWVEVKLPNKVIGWIPKKNLERI
ncbi:MAG: tetratricopeptide repeat protein [bacterium]|nr:tetratricopeptide repeat protein [bacterium]